MPIRFTQPCPICGRQMRISVELLGREVACQHCHGEFVAGQDDTSDHILQREQMLMDRVEQMLRQVDPKAAWESESAPEPPLPESHLPESLRTGELY